MNDNQIIQALESAISNLMTKDEWLLLNNISERSISHKLAEHLQNLIKDYNIDCEYNGSVGQPNEKKKIIIVKEQLAGLGLLNISEQSENEEDLIQRSVFPDIIVHARGTQESNICIIEIKKDTSSVPPDYDHIKLKAYTSNIIGNYLNYQLGVLIQFITGKEPRHSMTFYKDGQEFNIKSLKP